MGTECSLTLPGEIANFDWETARERPRGIPRRRWDKDIKLEINEIS
jgi:hypothetical protein